MKVLVISSTVSSYISVGNITLELNRYLTKKGHESYVLYYDNSDNPDCKKFKRIRAKVLNMLFYHISTRSHYLICKTPFMVRKIRKIIEKYKPDVIHLIQQVQCYVNNQELFTMLGKTNIPCVYTMIDENPYLGECDNAYDCMVFCNEGCIECKGDNREANYLDFHHRWSYNGCRRVAKTKEKGYSNISNICFAAPQWVVERAQSSQLLKNRQFYVVDEYVDNENVYVPRQASANKWRDLNIDVKKVIVLNVAKYSNARKGVSYFVELAKKMEDNENYIFVNVGFDGDDRILPSNYVAVPFIKSQEELAEFLTIADLHITTSLSDTMPNILLEALSCGTPVCGFNITGIPYVAEVPLGYFVEAGNVQALIEIVERTGKKKKDLSDECRKYALKRFSPEVCLNKYLDIYTIMLGRKSFL